MFIQGILFTSPSDLISKSAPNAGPGIDVIAALGPTFNAQHQLPSSRAEDGLHPSSASSNCLGVSLEACHLEIHPLCFVTVHGGLQSQLLKLQSPALIPSRCLVLKASPRASLGVCTSWFYSEFTSS